MPSSISDVRIVMVTLTLGSPRNVRRIDSAPLAQSAEQLTLNQWVQGSSPWGCTMEGLPQSPETFWLVSRFGIRTGA